MPSVAGSVYVDGTVVGSVSGTYQDASADGSAESVQRVTIDVVVYVDGSRVGYGTLEYDDYVTLDGGGQRTITVANSIYVDGTAVGTVTAELVDTYGAVVAAAQPTGINTMIRKIVVAIVVADAMRDAPPIIKAALVRLLVRVLEDP